MTTFTAGATQTFAARTPEDVLAAVPVVLGFVPEESVVMLTFGAEHPFHARLDLPVDGGRAPRGGRGARRARRPPRGRRVLFVLYTDDPRARPVRARRRLVRAFTDEGIEVVDVLRSDGRCWFEVPVDGSSREAPGTPYDVSGHLFTAEAVASGRVTRSSRAELAATVAADPEACAAVGEAVRELEPHDLLTEGAAVRAVVTRWAAGLGPPDPLTSARLLVALRDAASQGRRAVVRRPPRGRAAAARLVGAGQVGAGRPGGPGGVGAGLPRLAGRRRCAGLVRPRAGRRGRPALHPGRRRRRGARAGPASGGVGAAAVSRPLPKAGHPP